MLSGSGNLDIIVNSYSSTICVCQHKKQTLNTQPLRNFEQPTPNFLEKPPQHIGVCIFS